MDTRLSHHAGNGGTSNGYSRSFERESSLAMGEQRRMFRNDNLSAWQTNRGIEKLVFSTDVGSGRN